MPPVNQPSALGFLYGRVQRLRDNSISDFIPSHNILSRSDILPAKAQDQATQLITARDSASTYVNGQGAAAPTSFNNAGYLALFAIIGTGMVVASIWFFFWAKNGGFQWRKTDWEDYKSTVLRRKGPDGRTLSNATKSTKLGGGSSIAGTQHYKWQKQIARSVVGRDEKGRKGIYGKRGFAGTHSITYSDDYMTESFGSKSVTDEMTEVNTLYNSNHDNHAKRYKDRDVKQYKKEKAARVGGLNRVADGTSYNPTNSEVSDTHTVSSDGPILSNKQAANRDNAERERREAKRQAKEEAVRMERRWRKEAEAAAAALARENEESVPKPPAHRKSAAPSSRPTQEKTRHRAESRSSSPKKRDFSYQTGAASEVLSTAYTGSSRTASYYDSYRPKHDGYSSDGGARASRSAPKKTGKGREGGYRRGADSDFD